MDPIDPPAIVRQVVDLTALAAVANAEHQHAEMHRQAYQEHARAAGMALVAIKAEMPGEFKRWAIANLTYAYRTATRYMALASRGDTVSPLSDAAQPPRSAVMSLKKLLADIAKGKTTLTPDCAPLLRQLADALDAQATPQAIPTPPPPAPEPAPKPQTRPGLCSKCARFGPNPTCPCQRKAPKPAHATT
jgi:hypothetical protein